MSGQEDMTALEGRLRRLMSGLDARPGFEERLRARIASAAPPRAELRARLEARRLAVRRRLRREAWTNGVTAIGVVAAMAALLWRIAPAMGRFAGSALTSADPLTIGSATLAVLALVLWPVLRSAGVLRIG
jgi:hypothetical protein